MKFLSLIKGKFNKAVRQDIYDEPINRFVADFIGESNIVTGKMIEDYLVEFVGNRFDCVDRGFNPNETVEIVIRPEDLEITSVEKGKAASYVSILSYSVGFTMRFAVMMKMEMNGLSIQRKKQRWATKSDLYFDPEAIHVMRLVKQKKNSINV